MSEMPAMDDDIREAGHSKTHDDEAVSQGLVANKAEDQTPGDMLRDTRLAHEYSVGDLSRQTMLPHDTIEALEDNRFDQLSQPVFVRGYLRKCANVLDMDSKALLRAYEAAGGARAAGVSGTPRQVAPFNVVPADVTPDRRRTFGSIFVIIILLVVVFAGYLLWTKRAPAPAASNSSTGISLDAEFSSSSAQTGSANNTTSLAAALSASDRTPGQPAQNSAPVANHAGNAGTPGPATAAAAATAVTRDTGAAASGSGTTGMAATDGQSGQTATGGGTTQTAAASAAQGTTLTLEFDQRSWVEVHDATGRQLLVGIYENTTRTLEGVPPYQLVIGYAPGVDVRYGGEPVEFEVADNNTARFTVGSGSG